MFFIYFQWKSISFYKFLAKRFAFIRNSSYICTCLQIVDYDAHRGGRSYWAGHYIREKRHTMLCRLADET